MKPLRILSSDLLIADQMVPIPEGEALAKLDDTHRLKYAELNRVIDELCKKQKIKRGQKGRLTPEEFAEVCNATAGLPTDGIQAGGSSANTLTTLGKMMGQHIDVDFIGVVGGNGLYSNIIRGGLVDAGINLVPETLNNDSHIAREAALSFVFTHPDGERTIFTYPGNARELLKPEMVTHDMVEESDVVFVQGSLWEKLDHGLPNKLLEMRWHKDKEIWLALPTHAKFSDNMPTATYRWLITSADLVLGNDEELMRIYETGNRDEAIKALQLALKERDAIRQKEGKAPREKEAMAFITCGLDGALVVTPERIIKVDVAKLKDESAKKYRLGAGDTSFAGFLAGYISDLTPKACAQLGMELAGLKLGHNSARLPDPASDLKNGSTLAKTLFQQVERNITTYKRNGETSAAAATVF